MLIKVCLSCFNEIILLIYFFAWLLMQLHFTDFEMTQVDTKANASSNASLKDALAIWMLCFLLKMSFRIEEKRLFLCPLSLQATTFACSCVIQYSAFENVHICLLVSACAAQCLNCHTYLESSKAKSENFYNLHPLPHLILLKGHSATKQSHSKQTYTEEEQLIWRLQS